MIVLFLLTIIIFILWIVWISVGLFMMIDDLLNNTISSTFSNIFDYFRKYINR